MAPNTAAYADNQGKRKVTLKDLGEMCRSRMIPKTGKRYALVLRILKHDNPTVESSGAKTSKATKKKAPAAKKSRAEIVSNKIKRKIASGSTNKKYDSHWGAKTHSEDVYQLLNETLDSEIMTKDLVTKKPKLGLEIAKAAFTSLTENFGGIRNVGYDMSGKIPEAIETLSTIVECALPGLDDQEQQDAIEWIEKLQEVLDPYGLLDYAASTLKNLLTLLEEGDDDDTMELAEEDTKPRAKASVETCKENHAPNVLDI